MQLPEQVAVVTAVVPPKRPEGHKLHELAPTREYCPLGHRNAVEEVDPAAHAYPAVQFPEQAAVVMLAFIPYWPAEQLEHTPAPSKLYVPAGHSAQMVLPPGENSPAGQELQLDCRVSRLYCPVKSYKFQTPAWQRDLKLNVMPVELTR